MIVLASDETETAAYYRGLREQAEAEAREAEERRKQTSPMASMLASFLGGLRGA